MTNEISRPQVDAKRKKRGYWQDINNVLHEVAIWRKANGGVFPTQKALAKTGDGSLANAILSYHSGFRTLREVLGEKQKRRPNGYWENFENIRAEIEEWQRTHDGEFPTKPALDLAGMSALGIAICRRHDGYIAVRQRLQEQIIQLPSGHWKDFENVRVVMEQYRFIHGKIPSLIDLSNAGHSSVADAISKYHGGSEVVRSKFNEHALQQTSGHWRNFENVRVVIDEYKHEHGKFPTHADLQRINKSAVSTAINKYHGGFTSVRKKMGELLVNKKLPKGHWQNFENVHAAIVVWIEEHNGRFPSQRELRSTKLSGLSSACDYFGGFPAVREKMGYGPITDALIVTHANDLARIVIELGVSTDRLWSAIKSEWVEQDLTAAVEEFRQTGSTDRFRMLLDGKRSS